MSNLTTPLINNIKLLEETVFKSNRFVSSSFEDVPVFKFNSSNYNARKFTKKRIVLHYTAGGLVGDFSTLALQKNKISVAFIIARNGKIIQLFNPDYWAYHLGATALGGNETQSKQTIGIEISNWGWLELKGDMLYTYGTPTNPSNPYCNISETDKYIKTPIYRGKEYWAIFTDEQYTSIKQLLTALTKKYNINYDFLPEKDRLVTTNDVTKFNGIVTHVNYRGLNVLKQYDKWDIGPAFDWNKIKP